MIDYTKIYNKFEEKIFGEVAITYHRTPFNYDYKKYNVPRTPQNVLINEPILNSWTNTTAIKNLNKIAWGFRSGNGDAYGRGMYSVFNDNLINKSSGGNRGYGDIIIKFKVSNLSNYLFVDWTEFSKTSRVKSNAKRYNSNNYIYMQLVDAGVPIEIIARLESRIGFNISNTNIIETYGRESFAKDFAPYFEGFIYTGGSNDGDVLVTFDLNWIAKNIILNYTNELMPEFKKMAVFPTNKKNIEISDLNKLSSTSIALLLKKLATTSQTNKIGLEPAVKIQNLIDNFNNLKSIYPMAFSIDDSKTWTPIPVSDEVKDAIYKLSHSYQASNIMFKAALSSPAAILKAYTKDDMFMLPISAVNAGQLSFQDIFDYLKEKNIPLQIMVGQKNDYYTALLSIINNMTSNGCILNSVYFSSDSSYGEINLSDKNLTDIISKIHNTNPNIKFLIASSTNTIEAEPSIIGLLQNFEFKTNLVLRVTGNNLNFSNFDKSKVITAFTELQITDGYLTAEDIQNIKKFLPKITLLKINYNKRDNTYDEVNLTSNSANITHDFDNFNKLSYFKFLEPIKKIEIKKAKVDKLFFLNSAINLEGLLQTKGIILNQVILSTVKDKLAGRPESVFIASYNLGIRNLSMLGKMKLLGSEITSATYAAMDYEAFKSIQGHLNVEHCSIIYFPNMPNGEKITIDDDFMAALKKMNKGVIHLCFRGSIIGNDCQFILNLTPDNKKKFMQYAEIYSEAPYSKYIDASVED